MKIIYGHPSKKITLMNMTTEACKYVMEYL